MNSLIQEIPQLLIYKPAVLALSVLCLAVLTQNFLCAPLAFLKGEQIPGEPLKGGHDFFSFRVIRTHMNSVESLPVFGLALIISILIGVNSSLVNWLAIIHVAFRLIFWAVYYSGIGVTAGGPRTLCFVGGLLCNIVLVIACIQSFLF